ncbi:MAG: phosphatase PAP2 family protein [Arachidicoccus sp.]|nr:phosphatase PAP2 family protein [Arachidicoccus sp.]
MENTRPATFTVKRILLTFGISALYLILCNIFIGYKTEQLVLVILFNTLYYLSSGSRKFILAFSIFIAFWVLFDFMKGFPNYQFSTVHIKDIYELEKSWFGIKAEGKIVTLNEYFWQHHCTVADIFAGFFYLCWMPVPILFGVYLFYTNKRKGYINFALTFLWVNLIGFVIYYLCPSAPPWYIELHGFAFNAHTPGNTAGLGRFDNYFHVHIFQGLYAQSSNVFAAMPSLHASYPTIVLYHAIKNRQRWYALVFFCIVMLGIWSTAVYANHHYLLDVVAGVICAAAGIISYNFMYEKLNPFHRFVDSYARLVS